MFFLKLKEANIVKTAVLRRRKSYEQQMRMLI